MKYLGFKRTPVYVRGAGPDRQRDIIVKGHKARERRSVPEVIEGQIDAGDALFEIACDTSNVCPYCGTEDPSVDPDDPNEWQCCIRQRITEELVDPAIWPELIEEMRTWRVIEEDEDPEPECYF